MSPNEFTNKRDAFGLLQTVPETQNYLRLEKSENVSYVQSLEQMGINTWYALKIELSDLTLIQERESYTFMTLMADFGGFNDAIVLIFTVLMSSYNSRMF